MTRSVAALCVVLAAGACEVSSRPPQKPDGLGTARMTIRCSLQNKVRNSIVNLVVLMDEPGSLHACGFMVDFVRE